MRDPFSRSGFERVGTKITLERGLEDAQRIIKSNAVSFDSFEALYSPESIRHDKAYVSEQKARFRENIDEHGKQCGTILEAITHLRAKKADWFGVEARATKTNEYDDIRNGIDEVITIVDQETQKNVFSFGIDIATTGSGPLNVGVGKKMERIFGEVERGSLAEVKYFSDTNNETIGLRNIPRLVVGAETKTVEELNELWVGGDLEKLRKHPIQVQLLEQIIEQSREIKGYAERNGKKEIVEKYEQVEIWARTQLKQKTSIRNEFWNDNASAVISNALFKFKDVRKIHI